MSTKISELPSATSLTGADEVPIVQTGTTKKATIGQIQQNANYSTTEQVVGTWIDGKPLYQKTFELTNVSGTQTISAFSVASIDKIIEITGTVTVIVTDVRYPVNSYCTSANRFYCIASNVFGGELEIGGGTIISNNYNAYVTVRYTKTADTV